MDALSKSFFECTAVCSTFWFAKAAVDAKNDHKISACFSGVMGSLFLFGGAAAATTPQAYPASSCENGELYMGYCFPYDQYPHGHCDCAHGSTVFQYTRSAENEDSRHRYFLKYGHCSTGIGDLVKTVGDVILTCFSNGTLVKSVLYPIHDNRDIL